MPVYEYRCRKCNVKFSKFFQSFDTGEVLCPECSSKDVKKCISNIMMIKSDNESNNTSSSSCSSCSSGNCSSCKCS